MTIEKHKRAKGYTEDLQSGKRVVFRSLRRGVTETKVREEGDEDRVLEFIASTDGIKRDGNRVRNDGWDFTNFSKNPVFLWGHDSGSPEHPPLPPIGSIIKYWVEEDADGSRLMIRVRFATHELADTVYQLYLNGHLRAVSIGWTPLEYEPILDSDGSQVGWDFLRSELLEVSAVPVPSDPDALMIAAARGILPQDQMAAFARAQRSIASDAYILDEDERASEDETPEEANVENAQTRELDQAAAGKIIDDLMQEMDLLEKAIADEDHDRIKECMARTENLIEEYEQMLHAVYDEHIEEDDVDVEEASGRMVREYDPAQLGLVRELLGDLRGDLEKLVTAVSESNAGDIAILIGHSMDRLSDMEEVLSQMYAGLMGDEEHEDEGEVEPEEMEVESEYEPEDEEEVASTSDEFDQLAASLDALIQERAIRAMQASEDAEAFAMSLIDNGDVNLTGKWEFDAQDGNAILGDPENPDWKSYADSHLARDTDSDVDTKAHYAYPFAKLQDGEIVLYVSALKAIRSYSSREGDESIFEAAGRIMEHVKAKLMDENAAKEQQASARSSKPVSTRIGKKISSARAGQLEQAGRMAQEISGIIGDVLEASAPAQDDEAERLLSSIENFARGLADRDEAIFAEEVSAILTGYASPESKATRLLRS